MVIGSQCDIPLTLKIGKKVIHMAKDPVCGGELASLHHSKQTEARYMCFRSIPWFVHTPC
jgi:hypothetical protein